MLSQLFHPQKELDSSLKKKEIHSVQSTQHAVSSGCRAAAWELRRKEGQWWARSAALPKGLFAGWHRSLRLPAEQGAQPASQGDTKNLSLVMPSLKIFWHFPCAPVTFHLDISCNFRLVRYWSRIILLNERNPTTDIADMKIHALLVIR